MEQQPEVERRRSPRASVRDHSLTVTVSVPARVVEIGMGGVLIDCGGRVSIRDGRLSLPLGAARFSSQVGVRYHRALAGTTEYLVGAAFIDLETPDRHALEQFLAKAMTK